MEEITNSIGLRLKLIPAGIFMMGSEDDNEENPIREVQISQPFYCGVYPVTQAQAEVVFGLNPGYFLDPNRPVTNANWNQANDFCLKLSEREGKRYRLLKEAEWEYVCRGGTTTKFFWGENEHDAGIYAWYRENSDGRTHDVGQKQPNAWGLYDMVGNVEEWCDDVYNDSSESYGKYRITRGGSYLASSVALRCALPGFYTSLYGEDFLGFRVALNAFSEKKQDFNVNDVVDILVSIYRENPKGFVVGEGGEYERKIRRIGEELNNRGGMELMREAHRLFSRKCFVIPGAARNLEFMWDGIGSWRG
jgi:formylglycine-generating enzyme required for sulfatase activity